MIRRIVGFFESLLCLTILYGICAIALNPEYICYIVIGAIFFVVIALVVNSISFYCR